MRRITLDVASALNGVGLTAAMAGCGSPRHPVQCRRVHMSRHRVPAERPAVDRSEPPAGYAQPASVPVLPALKRKGGDPGRSWGRRYLAGLSREEEGQPANTPRTRQGGGGRARVCPDHPGRRRVTRIGVGRTRPLCSDAATPGGGGAAAILRDCPGRRRDSPQIRRGHVREEEDGPASVRTTQGGGGVTRIGVGRTRPLCSDAATPGGGGAAALMRNRQGGGGRSAIRVGTGVPRRKRRRHQGGGRCRR